MPELYVGYTLKARPDWESYVGEIKAPGNYKDPVKIAAYIDDAKKRKAAEASERVLTGQLDELMVIARGDRITVDGAVAFFDTVMADYTTIVCVKPFHLLRILVAEYVVETKKPAPKWAVRSETFGHPLLLTKKETDITIIDPVRALVGSTSEEQTDPDTFMKRFDLKVEGAGAERMVNLAKEAGKLIGV